MLRAETSGHEIYREPPRRERLPCRQFSASGPIREFRGLRGSSSLSQGPSPIRTSNDEFADQPPPQRTLNLAGASACPLILPRMDQKAYARAGVDIDLGNQVKAALPRLLAATRRREVLGQVGGFGGLFALDTRKYKHPVLVSSIDGVGTKLKIAFALDRHDTIGEDLVNHCVNDIAVLGAEPLFF